MTRFRIVPAGPLRGQVRVPGDPFITRRALLFAALGRGRSTLRGVAPADHIAAQEVLRAMGVTVEAADDTMHVHGVGLRGLRLPRTLLDCGEDDDLLALVTGLLAGQRFGTRVVAGPEVSETPVDMLVEPLRARGAHIAGSRPPKGDGETLHPPISVAPLVEGETLVGIEVTMPVPRASTKSGLLLSALYADGPTILGEPMLSPDHTERMMVALGVPLRTAGTVVYVHTTDWAGGWDAFDWTLPGDPTAAATLLVAALAVPDSAITVAEVGVNPTRAGFLDQLRLLGAPLAVVPKGAAASDEPIADLTVRHAALRGAMVGGELVCRMPEELPALGALARSLPMSFSPGEGGAPRLMVDGVDRSDDIRTPQIADGASAVSRHPPVRAALLGVQRRLGADGGVVLEGRDIGTVVFPDAEIKVFLTASSQERARRRVGDLRGRGQQADPTSVQAALEARDRQDSTRPVAPLRPADDAVQLDSTELSFDEVVARVLELARSRS